VKIGREISDVDPIFPPALRDVGERRVCGTFCTHPILGCPPLQNRGIRQGQDIKRVRRCRTTVDARRDLADIRVPIGPVANLHFDVPAHRGEGGGAGGERYRRVIARNGGLVFFQLAQRTAAVCMGLGMVRPHSDRRVVARHGSRVLPEVLKRARAVEVGFCVAGPQSNCFVIARKGGGVAAQLHQHAAAVEVRIREARLEKDGPVITCQGSLVPPQAAQFVTAVVIRVGVVRANGDGLLVARNGGFTPIEG